MTSTVRVGISGAALLAAVTLAACGNSSSVSPQVSVDDTVATSSTAAPDGSAVASTSTSTSIVPDDSLPPGETWTRLTLQDVGPALQPSRVLMELTPDAAGTISLDGLIVVTKPAAKDQGLYILESNGSLVDTGIRAVSGSTLRFGPRGDLFVREPNADYSQMTFSEYQRSAKGAWPKVVSATGPGCDTFVVTPSRVGCPDGTGPAIELDPPVPFDLVTEARPLVARGERVVRTHGAGERSWNVLSDGDGLGSATNDTVPLRFTCDSDTCHSLYIPGPGSSAIWYPLLAEDATGRYRQGIFLFDDGDTARAAILEGDRVDVLGVLGTELICVQTAAGATRLVAYDLPH
jgi:hypothetical protein